MSDPDPKSVARPRWRPRLSLRALMVLVLIVGLPLGWVARRAALQRRSVAMVKARGGQVYYEDQIDSRGRPNLPHAPGGPRWLRQRIGDEFFQEVAWVSFEALRGQSRVDDDSIATVNAFAHLQGLTIRGPGHADSEERIRLVTEAGLARLTGLPRLRALHLYHIHCDDAMVRLLPRWKTLEDVQIYDFSKILSGSSLRHLGQLPLLQAMVVNSVESSQPEDLASAANLRNLRNLTVMRSPVVDTGVENLGAVSTLEVLNLGSTEMTEPTLKELSRIPGLISLSFDGSRLTQGGFRALSHFKALVNLDIYLGGVAGEPNTHHLIHHVSARFDDTDLDALQSVPLRHLIIMGLNATDAGVGRLLASHRFDELALSGRGITDASIPALAQQTGLSLLALADTGITDAGLAQLAAIPGLETLSLVDNACLTETGVTALQTFPRLDYLTIRQPGLGPTTLESLRAARLKLGTFNMFQPPDEDSR